MTLEQLEASLQWARHHSAARWCRVAGFNGGSVLTVCRGRWPTTDAYETHVAPPIAERCLGCEPSVEAGLAELRNAPAIATVPAPLWAVEQLDDCAPLAWRAGGSE